MGGNQTLAVAIPHLDRFAYIGVYSSGLLGAFPGLAAAAAARRRPQRLRQRRAPQLRPRQRRPRPAADGGEWEKENAATLDNANLKKGLKAVLVRHRQGRLPADDDERDRRAVQEARLHAGLQGDGRAATRGSTGATT